MKKPDEDEDDGEAAAAAAAGTLLLRSETNIYSDGESAWKHHESSLP